VPPRIIPVLGRLRQDIAAGLAKEAIEEACRQCHYSWRKRILDTATTLSLFLLQILHGNTACRHVVHFGGWAFNASAFCQARSRLPLAVFRALGTRNLGEIIGAPPGTTVMQFSAANARRSRFCEVMYSSVCHSVPQ